MFGVVPKAKGIQNFKGAGAFSAQKIPTFYFPPKAGKYINGVVSQPLTPSVTKT